MALGPTDHPLPMGGWFNAAAAVATPGPPFAGPAPRRLFRMVDSGLSN